MVMHPHIKYNWPIWKDKKGYGLDMLRREEAEEAESEEKIRLKQYVSFVRRGDIIIMEFIIYTVRGNIHAITLLLYIRTLKLTRALFQAVNVVMVLSDITLAFFYILQEIFCCSTLQ